MTDLIVNSENIAPQENIIKEAPVAPLKPVAADAPAETPAETPANAEEEEEIEEEDEEIEEGEEEEEDEEEEEAIEYDEQAEEEADNYGEQSLEGFPLSAEEEAREAEELAKTLGLGSTNEALARVATNSDKIFSATLSKYAELISQDAEAAQLYDGLTTEIAVLNASINSGLHKMVSDMGVQATPDAIDAARAMMENYLRVVIERSVIHSEYRQQQDVAVPDILSALSVLGRPLYWNANAASSTGQLLAQPSAEEDAEDGEWEPMDEEGEGDDDESSDEEEDEGMDEEAKPEGEEAVDSEDEAVWLETNSFKRLVDVVTSRFDGVSICDEGYHVLRASAEDYLNQLFDAALKSAAFAGRNQSTQQDVRFAQMMTLKI